MPDTPGREATVERTTKETAIAVTWNLDGRGQTNVETGIGMLDHMLEQLGKHGRFGLWVRATGDLHVDAHHTIEDVGLALGQALNRALGDRAGIERMADRSVALDEALVQVVVDLSGRPYASVDLRFSAPVVGALPTQMVAHLLESLAMEARITLHVRQISGDNDHHIMEAAFKALARALRDASRVHREWAGDVPSTKGTLTA